MFQPGDTIGILPVNREEEIELIISRLGLEDFSDDIFYLKIKENTQKKGAKLPPFIPIYFTIKRTLKNCLEFHGVLKKLFLRTLAIYTTNSQEKKVLEILSSKEGTFEYNELCLQQKINILDILTNFKTCKPPFSTLLENLPRLLPRPYSIASSPVTGSNEIRIVFSMLEKETGLTTGILEDLVIKHQLIENDESLGFREMKLGDEKSINLYLRESTRFKYTEDNIGKNLIMIGPGTGIAPFIGFLEHRFHFLQDYCEEEKSDTCAILFTGCRYKTRNYLYEDKLKFFLRCGTLNRLYEAFSRDSDSKFKYVQDQILENGEEFVELFLKDETVIYVCGEGKKMAPSVEAIIVECLREFKNFAEEDAKQIILDFKKSGKYLEDIWIG